VAAKVLSGGSLQVFASGLASGAVVSAGGVATIAHGGATRATSVSSGGMEKVGGATTGTVVLSGGQEVVLSGGVASASVVSNGGVETVSSGGALAGGLKIAGGEAIISGTVAAGQTVTFTTSGDLELDNLAGFGAKISGLTTSTQKIDLGGFTFSAGETVTWTQAGTSGTLKVTDGAKTASLTLIGTYTTANFHLSNDGHGGTFVVDPPVTPATAPFVQAIAGFRGEDASPFAGVHSGGAATVAAQIVAVATSGR
jgi:autotransporter passenger strand-loop-strand repeat protein